MNNKNEIKENIHEWANGDPIMEEYAKNQWGKKLSDDNQLFEIMSLEIFQAGLNWKMILKRRNAFYKAFKGWDIDKVASLKYLEIENLVNDATIIRNRRKIESCIENARRIQSIQKQYGSFCNWFYNELEGNDIEPLQKTLKKTFKFIGPEIARMWLMATGRIDSNI